MPNKEHLRPFRQGVGAWNKWRNENPETRPELSGANLNGVYFSGANLNGVLFRGTDLSKANLRGVHLVGAKLNGAYLSGTDLSEADLSEGDLTGAHLSKANLSGAHLKEAWLIGADFRGADLSGADLTRANLTGADIREAILVETKLGNANLTGCQIYGISAWNLKVNEETKQSSLIITQPEEPTVTVDDLEVAQFIYLLLNRQKLRDVIETITSKAVLILGRFTPERKVILDAMGDELRKHNLIPIIFDFERATSRDFTETIKILAGLSLFVIADITNPKSAPLELQAIVPDYQIPFVPIIQEGENPFSMFNDLRGKYEWMLDPVDYSSRDTLLAIFETAVLNRAWEMHQKLQKAKEDKSKILSWKDFLR